MSRTIKEFVEGIINNWVDWRSHVTINRSYARIAKKGVKYVTKRMNPKRPGIALYVSQFDKELVEAFKQAELYNFRRFKETLHGLLGLKYRIDLKYSNSLNHKSTQEYIKELLDDSTFPKIIKDEAKFKALLSFTHTASKAVFRKPQEFLMLMKQLGYFSENGKLNCLFEEYFNYAAEIEKYRNEALELSSAISTLTSDIQLEHHFIKERKLDSIKVNGRMRYIKSKYYGFKVYDDQEGIKEKTLFDKLAIEEGVPF